MYDWILSGIREQQQSREKQKLQDQEYWRKSFIQFTKPENQTVVDHMKSISDKDLFTENYLLFMEKLGKPITAEITTCTKAVPHFPDNIIGEVLESGCKCHEVTLLCVMRNSKLHYHFGFVDYYRDGVYQATVAHSFLISDCGKFLFDMYRQFETREPWNSSTPDDDVRKMKDQLRNYFAAEIPFSIIAEIWHAREKKENSVEYANPWRYIKNNIFTSREKTLQFIKRIQKLQGTVAHYESVNLHIK